MGASPLVVGQTARAGLIALGWPSHLPLAKLGEFQKTDRSEVAIRENLRGLGYEL